MQEGETTLQLQDVALQALLWMPKHPRGLILFAHGSGSSRFSPRNQQVARLFNEAGFATLLMDLLTPEEEEIDNRTRGLRFAIALLAERVAQTVDLCRQKEPVASLPLGLIGSSTGAAAALIAAAKRPQAVSAVVSRGGRPDLAGDALSEVKAPTLLIVGANDDEVIQLNDLAMSQMDTRVDLELVPGATHLFSEPGTLEKAGELAKNWFLKYLYQSLQINS